MGKFCEAAWRGKKLCVGLDLHKREWSVTVLTEDGLELLTNRVPGKWVSLRRLLSKYWKLASGMEVAYEAGFAGYWLADHLRRCGVDVTVTPPNKIPHASGDRVKTDSLDSRKLATYLRAGLLKRVTVPTVEQRQHREVARRRRKIIESRCRVQAQIKSFLAFYGIDLETRPGKWSRTYVTWLHGLKLKGAWGSAAFCLLLEQFDQFEALEQRATALLRDLSRSEAYAHQVELLCTIPGVGWKTAIEILVELLDVRRFRRSDQLGAYLGLTPSQASSGERVRMGRITKQGKPNVRMLLVEAAWRLIRKDAELRQCFTAIKARSGSKKAIVAIARRLVIRMRRILLDRTGYALSIAA